MQTKPHAVLEVTSAMPSVEKGRGTGGASGEEEASSSTEENMTLIKKLKVVRNFSKTYPEDEHSRPWARPVWLQQREQGKKWSEIRSEI